MFFISLGSGCFCHPNSEESMDLIVAAKMEYTNLSEFTKNCIKRVWERDCESNCCDLSLEKRYALAANRIASGSEVADMIQHLRNLKWVELADIRETQIKNVIVLFEPKWNLESFVFETENNYIYAEWTTTV